MLAVLLFKFFWNISEGLCDIILKGTVYLQFSVCTLSYFQQLQIILKLVAGFTFISFSLRLARNKMQTLNKGLGV